MLNSSLCDYSDVYILTKATISIAAQVGDNPNNGDKELVFKTCAAFTDCISEINNTQIGNAKDIDVEMPLYSLVEYKDNNSKKLRSLWKYYRYEPGLTNARVIAKFYAANNSASFKPK